MKNAFDGLISRLDTAEERIFELEDVSTEISKMEKQRGKKTGIYRTKYMLSILSAHFFLIVRSLWEAMSNQIHFDCGIKQRNFSCQRFNTCQINTANYLCNWPLNNMGLNCTGPLIHGFFFSKYSIHGWLNMWIQNTNCEGNVWIFNCTEKLASLNPALFRANYFLN